MKKIIKSFIVLIVILQPFTLFGFSIDEDWIFSVAFIVNQSTNKTGTGFFVLRKIEEGKGKMFLVSNKHVLMPKSISSDSDSKLATALVYITTEENSNLSITNFPVILRKEDGTDVCVGHPKKNVDVAVIEVTHYVVENKTIRRGYKVGYIKESRFATKESIKETSLTIGDRIVILGYPLNMLEGSTAVALARGGTISTPPDRDYRKNPFFLIDCSTIRGSSGSPVFVPVRPYKVERKPNGNVQINTFQGYIPELLGIVSATISDWEIILKKTVIFGKEPQTVSVMDTANLGIVFRSDIISETIDATGIMRYIKNDQN